MTDNYPPDWRRRRQLVLDRDDHTCINCDAVGGDRGPAALHVHHIVHVAADGSHDLGNLTTLCSRCHSAVHGALSSVERSDHDIGYNDDVQGEEKRAELPVERDAPGEHRDGRGERSSRRDLRASWRRANILVRAKWWLFGRDVDDE